MIKQEIEQEQTDKLRFTRMRKKKEFKIKDILYIDKRKRTED